MTRQKREDRKKTLEMILRSAKLTPTVRIELLQELARIILRQALNNQLG